MSVGEAVEKLRLRNINAAQAASDEHDYVQQFDRGNPADTLIEHVAKDAEHRAQGSAVEVNGVDFSMDSSDEDDQVAPLRDDAAANSVMEHANQDTLHVVETGAENKMAFDQSCDEAEFEGFEDADVR